MFILFPFISYFVKKNIRLQIANGSDSDANAADDGMDDDIDEHSNSKQSGLSS